MSPTIEEAEAVYAACAEDLLVGLDASVVGWVQRLISERSPSIAPDETAEVGRQIHQAVLPRLEALLHADVDAQAAGPLGVLRDSLGAATSLLEAHGVPRPVRDEFDQRNFPDDPYGLGPATFDDVDPALGEVGIRWGAAKAHLVLTRRRVKNSGG